MLINVIKSIQLYQSQQLRLIQQKNYQSSSFKKYWRKAVINFTPMDIGAVPTSTMLEEPNHNNNNNYDNMNW